MHINLCCVCNGSSQYAGFVTVDKTSVVQLHYTPRRSAAAFEIVRQNSDPKNEESFYCVSKYLITLKWIMVLVPFVFLVFQP